MSNLAMAAHHHHHKHHHGAKSKLPHVKLPSLSHLEAKVSSLVSVAQGNQGPTARDALLAGLALLAFLLIYGWRKVRRS